jgi:hypothetical protein
VGLHSTVSEGLLTVVNVLYSGSGAHRLDAVAHSWSS